VPSSYYRESDGEVGVSGGSVVRIHQPAVSRCGEFLLANSPEGLTGEWEEAGLFGDFASEDGNLSGCVDGESDAVSADPGDGDFDVVADEDGFVGFAGEDEHGNLLSRLWMVAGAMIRVVVVVPHPNDS
jgi:hypothetical protein